ncbi:MAG TPA: hypothetical protein VEK11_16310 [Thermoanaerobaculia bacterium]|nr:hypothetical protein [Thermoanaerobaculia bacterium]
MPIATEPLTRSRRATLLVLSTVAALARFVPLSKGPWDWDEVLFCSAIGDYDVTAHYPHPPGFPLYIFLAKLARFFTATDFHALQTINVLAGMAVLPVLFWVARSLRFSFWPALVAASLFAFLPNVWFFGGTGFSDVPAMVLFLAAIAAYLGAGTSARKYAIASVLFGAALLVRPQNALVAVFPWTIATLRFVRAREWRPVIAGTLIAVAIAMAGYGLAAWATGFTDYYHALVNHSRYVRHADSVASDWRAPLHEVLLIQLDPYHAGKVSILVNLLALLGVLRGPRNTVLETLFTFAPFFLFAALVVNPLGSSRFSLNYMAGIILLTTLGIFAIADFFPRARLPIAFAFTFLIAGRFIYWVLPAFEQPRTTESAPVQAVQWVAKHVPKTSTIFMDESIWPWARYYIRDHELVHVFSYPDIVRHDDVRDGWYVRMNRSSIDSARHFIRPRNRTWNIVTPRAFEASVLPAAHMAAFTDGWYNTEGDEHLQWRWSKQRAFMELPGIGGTGELLLVFSVPQKELKRSSRVSFFWNGNLVTTYTTPASDNELTLRLRSREDGPNVLGIYCHDAFVPNNVGIGDDGRTLGIQFWSWRWRRL